MQLVWSRLGPRFEGGCVANGPRGNPSPVNVSGLRGGPLPTSLPTSPCWLRTALSIIIVSVVVLYFQCLKYSNEVPELYSQSWRDESVSDAADLSWINAHQLNHCHMSQVQTTLGMLNLTHTQYRSFQFSCLYMYNLTKYRNIFHLSLSLSLSLSVFL